ncbi:MAG: FG-GAP repeat protein, partial [Deltaproteobacteria bacterium]|nr:FG-GAP repeat protein [Deltaproteobacteria bacterium]
PVSVFIDSFLPTVTAVSIESDLDGNPFCQNADEGALSVLFSVDDHGNSLDGRTLSLRRDWPPGTVLGSGGISGGSGTVSATLADGLYDLTGTFSDALNNPNIRVTPAVADPEAQFFIEVDTLAPSLTITSPSKSTLLYEDDTNHATLDADAEVCVTTDAGEGAVVTFLLDGSSVGTAEVSNGEACRVVSISQGGHILRAQVDDACGNAGQSAVKNIFVDTERPSITCTAPSSGQTLTDADLPAEFTCSPQGTDNSQFITVVSTIGGPRCQPQVAGDPTVFNCNLQFGTQDIAVTVTDSSGNVSAPFEITNLEVNFSGCDVAFDFGGANAPVTLNLSHDEEGSAGLQISLKVCSSVCDSSTTPVPAISLWVEGSQIGPDQVFGQNATEDNCTVFQGVTFAQGAIDQDIEVQVDDGTYTRTDSFFVELVDIVPPTLVRSAPVADDVYCVANAGNVHVEDPAQFDATYVADKVAGAPCQMDFTFDVDDDQLGVGFDASMAIEESGSPISGPRAVNSAGAEDFLNLNLSDDSTHTLTVRLTDYAGNEVTLPMSVVADVVAPQPMTFSRAEVIHSRYANLALEWSASADADVVAYAVRYSVDATIVTEADWLDAVDLYNGVALALPTPDPVTFEPRLPPLNTYHLTLRALDEVGNAGALSSAGVDNMWDVHTYDGPGGFFAYDLWSIGDVNHDGYNDLAVGAHTEAVGGNTDAGSVYIFYGRADLSEWNDTDAPPQMLSRSTTGEKFGFDVGRVGSIDGTETCNAETVAIDDLVVCGRSYNSDQGRVSIYFGRCGNPLPSTPDLEIRGEATGNRFGYFAEMVGDVNNDGYIDLLVTGPTATAGGSAYLFFGRSRADWETLAGVDDIIDAADADLVILGRSGEDWYGYQHGIATLGDVDGDGFDEFVTSASSVNDAFVYDGAEMTSIAGSGLDAGAGTDALAIFHEGPSGMYSGCDPSYFCVGFGNRASGADLDHDGDNDLVVGAAYQNSVHWYENVSGVLDTTAAETVTLSPANAWFGWDLDVVDVNMDGWPDLMMGSNTALGHRAFLYLNSQNAADLFGEIASAVLSEDSDYYGISITADDFDGDGLTDIVIGSNVGTGRMYVHY